MATVLRFSRTILNWLIIGALLLIAYAAFNSFTVPLWQRGEFGGDLRLLKSYYAGPQFPGESNHIVDMLRNGSFREFLKIHGLTNNNALFVLSHGRAVSASSAVRYAFYPDEQVLTTARVPYFSARDLAEIMGPRAAFNIQNVVLAGCNVEGAFDTAEIRKYFVNVTNITHTPAGKNGYEFVFRHGLLYTSEGIKCFYQMPDTFPAQQSDGSPVYQATARLSPYISELFQPEMLKPFKIQVAGRELLGGPQETLGPKTDPQFSSCSVPLPSDARVDKGPMPIIMIGAGLKGDTSAQYFSGFHFPFTLGFLGIWRGVILNGLLALIFFRISAQILTSKAQ
jgi:hypothetical protein